MARTTEITTKQDMSRFARAHEEMPVNWQAFAGPGGTLILVEDQDEQV